MSALINRAELFNRLATCETKAEIFSVIQSMPDALEGKRFIDADELLKKYPNCRGLREKLNRAEAI